MADRSARPDARPSPGPGTLVVALVAEQPLRRHLVRLLGLDPALVIEEAADPAALAATAEHGAPHVAVLSAGKSKQEVADALRLLRAALPRTRWVVVLPRAGTTDVRAALRAGADGVVLESQAALTLTLVVRSVALGQASIPRDQRRDFHDSSSAARAPGRHVNDSTRDARGARVSTSTERGQA
jgi:DNA-binding NarL/FixJ family response regulator